MTEQPIPVIDLFAGPGGLGEGFASCPNDPGQAAFHVRLSIEMDPDARNSLELRAFFRQFRTGKVPEDYYRHLRGELSRQDLFTAYPAEAGRARDEASLAELGKVPDEQVSRRISDAIRDCSHWVLCGGPPCQAYSIVGRSRRGGINDADGRLYLYREYLSILADHEPSVFIVENVKGLLSSLVKGNGIFERLLSDLRAPAASLRRKKIGPHYQVLPLVQSPSRLDFGGTPHFDPRDFVIRSEQFGIPQSRHRVILLGVREDLAGRNVPTLTPAPREIPVSLVLQGLPKLRSGLSRSHDGPDEWRSTLQEVISSGLLKTLPNGSYLPIKRAVTEGLDAVRRYRAGRGGEFPGACATDGYQPQRFIDKQLNPIPQARATLVTWV